MSFETVDGLRLNGWFFAVEGPSPRMTVVVFNGNAGIERIAFPGRSAASARAAGAARRLPRLRRQSRDSIAGGLAADSRAARAFLVERPDVDSSRLVYFGESLETAVAVDLAVEHPPTALVFAIAVYVDERRGAAPLSVLTGAFSRWDRFASIDQIPQSRAPMLVGIAGGRDRIVPVESSRRVYEAATSPKTFLLIPKPITTITSCSRVTK